tara:strand:- start:112 stop:1488 length:1377 start_codon:yes stop_codon:yes gene_type:complete
MNCERNNKPSSKFESLKIKGQCSLKGKVKISGAKNSALVLLAASLLSQEKVYIANIPNLSDVRKMKNILESIGVKLTKSSTNQEELIINPKNLHLGNIPLNLVNELRASFFCIGPLLSKLGQASLALPGGCNIGERPIEEHINGLKKLGATITKKDGFVKAKIDNERKKLVGAPIELGCPSVGATETLIMAAVLAEGKTTISNAAREPEIQDLCEMLNKMGAKISGYGTSTILIQGVTHLNGCSHEVIPDRIEAGTFLIAAAATLSSITISPVIPEHLNSLISKLRESGSEIKIINNTISIKTNKIEAVNIETAPFPGFPTDLQAPFTALMLKASGKSIIKERIFENRMNHIELLKNMGSSIKLKNNIAIINGVESLNGKNLKGSDLRSTAAIIIAALTAEDISLIEGLEHLDRGYENFECKLQKLGADITRDLTKNHLNITPENELYMKNVKKLYAA